jgi:acetyl-CoA carboxylase beta subunit
MKWNNLRLNKCPKCDHAFKPEELTRSMIGCNHCSFSIRKERMESIIGEMNMREFEGGHVSYDPLSEGVPGEELLDIL